MKVKTFKVGECVVHRHEGVCKVTKISNVDYGDGKQKYYVLKPCFGNSTLIINVPLNNPILIRPHISKRSAQELVKKIKKSKTAWINDNRKRKEQFQSMIVSGDLEKLASIGNTVLIKKKEFAKAKKSMPLTDQNLANFCEKLLKEELAIALGIKLEDVDEYITKHSK